MKLPIPVEALAQHTIALGKTGAGKSSVLRLLVEQLLDQGKPVCIIDPKGDWWGLKSSANGRAAGYPVVIFGGEHADVPINEGSGGQVAELVAGGNRPCLIDLGGWMVGERTRFFITFASRFFKHARGLRHLVIDEAHNFAPQGRIQDPDSGKMLHWANRLASEGRGRGITLIAASQRPQKVHKDSVTSCETLIALRVIHTLDRKAIREWIDGCADPGLGREVLEQLAGMKRGEAWVWSPEIEFGPKRVQFPLFRTFDSFRPQASATELKGWAEVDLDEVRGKLAAVVAQAEANDPAFLKKRIKELEDAAARPVAHRDGADVAELRALRARCEQLERDQTLLRNYDEQILGAAALSLSIVEELADKVRELRAVKYPRRPKLNGANASGAAAAEPRNVSQSARAPRVQGAAAADRAGRGAWPGLGKGERVVLTAIAQHVGGVDPEQLTMLTGYKRSSRDTYLQRLRAAGFVSPGWPAVATESGFDALGEQFEPLPTGEELRSYWLDRLGGGERTILAALIEAWPNGLEKWQIDERTNYKRSSRDTYLQKLKARKLIDVVGQRVNASEALFT